MSAILESIDVQFAIDAVREAGRLVRRVQREMVGEALAKDDKSPVTVADFAAQALVAQRLGEAFPGAALVGEENALGLRSDEGRGTLEQVVHFVRSAVPGATAEDVCQWIDRGAGDARHTFWTLDPVDGTKGFLRRDQYAVALALVENGVVTIGVLGCPDLDDACRPAPGGAGSLVAAVRAEGAWTQSLEHPGGEWRRLAVSPSAEVKRARLLRSVEKGHTDIGGIEDLVRRLEVAADPVPMDSQAKYAVLAAGGGEALLRLISPSRPDYREKIWDQAAGSLVIEEAGGRISDLDGKSLDFGQGRTLAANRGVLATNGRLHEAFLAGLRAIKA